MFLDDGAREEEQKKITETIHEYSEGGDAGEDAGGCETEADDPCSDNADTLVFSR